MTDPIKRPPHYIGDNGVEFHHVLEGFQARWRAGQFELGCVIKYVLRHATKGDALSDLRKAREYLDRAIALHEPRDAELDRGAALLAQDKAHREARWQTLNDAARETPAGEPPPADVLRYAVKGEPVVVAPRAATEPDRNARPFPPRNT